jgi:hypothetical protein
LTLQPSQCRWHSGVPFFDITTFTVQMALWGSVLWHYNLHCADGTLGFPSLTLQPSQCRWPIKYPAVNSYCSRKTCEAMYRGDDASVVKQRCVMRRSNGEIRIRYWCGPWGMYGGHTDTGTGFSTSGLVSQCHLSFPHCSLLFIMGNGPIQAAMPVARPWARWVHIFIYVYVSM